MLRSLNIITTIVIIYLIVRDYQIIKRYLVYRKILEPKTVIYLDPILAKRFWTEIAVMLVISPPGYDKVYDFEQLGASITYSLDEMVILF
jgi:hypothetical protein